MPDTTDHKRLLTLTAGIVSAYLQKNKVAPEGLAGLITTVHAALGGSAGAPASAAPLVAAVPVMAAVPKRSIYPDYIICLEDGRKLKTLKRHLRAAYDLTPEQYREKWGLPQDYPMVAPNYAEKRSALARSLGLGRKAADMFADADAGHRAESDSTVMARPAAKTATRKAYGAERAEKRAAEPRAEPVAPPVAPFAVPAHLALDPEPRPAPTREPNADAVFARFPKAHADDVPEMTAEQIVGGGPKRIPFSKQRTRPMRK